MARSNRRYKKALNNCLDHILAGAVLANVSSVSRELSVSRTTVRRVFEHLHDIGILASTGAPYRVQRKPRHSDYYDLAETLSTEETIESTFMSLLQTEALSPGTRISESHLARQLGVSTPTVREFLIGLSRFGFIRREQHRRWVLDGFTKKYALELHEVRVMFESRAIVKVCGVPDNDPFWGRILRVREEHEGIDVDTDFRSLDFSAMDARFHRLLNSVADNRFISDFQDAISLIFHYHYLWNDQDPVQRNLMAAEEHRAIIDAILLRDAEKAVEAMQAHLATTHRTFLEAICH